MLWSSSSRSVSPRIIFSFLINLSCSVFALKFEGPRPTSTIDNEFKESGWTPRPTSPPELFRRQDSSGLATVCGYTIHDGDATPIDSCGYYSLCTYDTDLRAAGCCKTVGGTASLPIFYTDYCYLYTSCLPSSLWGSCYSNTACYSDPNLLWCTDGYYPNCWTYAWQDGPFTSYYCNSGTPTTPFSVFKVAPPICTDPAWQDGSDAWITSSFDQSLSSWWSSVSTKTVSATTTANFAQQLSCNFGSNTCNVQCGIGSGTACSNPSCEEYRTNNDPLWAYFASVSLTNMNDMLQAIYDGLLLGQLQLVGEINTIQQVFFPGQYKATKFQTSLRWINPIFSALGYIPNIKAISLPLKIVKAAASLISTGSSDLEDDPQVDMIINGEANLQNVETFIQQISNNTRRVLSTWSNQIFSGSPGINNNLTILDYFGGGRFTVPATINQQSVADFFYKNIISQMLGAKWNSTGGTYVLCTNNTAFTFNGSIPGSLSTNTSRMSSCALFSTQSSVKTDIAQLNNATFYITADEIVASSLGAYAFAKFNFTSEIGSQVLESSVSWSPDQQPWRQGVAWLGTWTIPVCDMPTANIQTSSGLTLPCCCGVNCNETAAFVKASQLGDFSGKSVCQKAYPKVKYVNNGLILTSNVLLISFIQLVIVVVVFN